MFDDFVRFVRELYDTEEFIPLYEPKFSGNEKKYLIETIDSTFVSSVGKFVNEFEHKVAEYTGIKYAIATVNGTAALHISLKLSGVEQGTEVITQSLTFVATCNAIRYCGAKPVFVDVDRSTLGLSPQSLENFLEKYNMDNFTVYLTGGATWEMMIDEKIAIEKELIPEDSIKIIAKKTSYKVVPFSRSLDTIEIVKLFTNTQT